MDAPARVTTGIAVAASLVLQACSLLPQDMAVEASSSAGPAQATFAQDNPSDGSVDQAIARLRNDLLRVESLETDAARLYAEAEKMPVERECTLEDFPDPECGPSPEAGKKMHQAGKLAAEASWLRRFTWQAATNLAEALRSRHFPHLANSVPQTETADTDPPGPSIPSSTGSADRRRQMAEVAELLARAGSAYPDGKPTTYMGDAYIPAKGGKVDPGARVGRPAGSSRPVKSRGMRSGRSASPVASGAAPARQALRPEPQEHPPRQTGGGEDSVFYSRAERAPAFVAPTVDPDPLAQANKASFQAIDGIVKGSAAVSAPSSAKSGDSFFVFLRVKPDELASLLESMRTDFPENETVIGKPNVELSSKMTASVSGAGFKAVPKGELTQVVSATEPTTWVWEVEATKSGVHTLTFALSGMVLVDGKPEPRNLYHYMQKVDVAVGVWGFVQEEWKWLIGTLALPALGFLWKEWSAKSKRKTAPPPGLAERLRRRRRVPVEN